MRLPREIGPIHFVGIGGIGMSGIAEIMHNLGYKVQGSDAAENANVKRLRGMGITVHVGHNADNLKDAHAVVYSSAVKPGNVEFDAARAEYRRIFGEEARTAGAAGWQSSALSRAVYDEAGLLYSSDTRGSAPFFPRIGGTLYRTPEIPSTLPTLDELMGRPEFPDEALAAHLLSLLRPDRLNVFTLHAEIEGMGRRRIFRDFLARCRGQGVEFIRLDEEAKRLLELGDAIAGIS